MTKEESLYLQVKPHFIDFLKKAELPYLAPAQTLCPYCNGTADIFSGYRWSCRNCKRQGDVVTYVMATEHLESKSAAIRRICRALQIKVTALDVISADALMDKQFESTTALIEGFIGRGVYLLAGAPKIGKSWLVLWLAHNVSLGEPIWDFQTRQCDVLYISLEDPEHRIQSRLAQVTRGETGRLWFATDTELIGNGFEEQLCNFLAEHTSVRFVIIDTLQKIRQLRADQYSYAGDYEVISQMKSLADRFGITILLVHHTRKSGAADPFSMISGTTGLSGGVDGSLVLIRDERMDGRAKLYTTGRDILDMELDLLFDRDSLTWCFLGYGAKEQIQKRDCLLTEINDLITNEGQFHGTASELLTLLSTKAELHVKSANALTRLLNPQRSFLQHEYGILYSCERSGKERTLHLTKVPDTNSDDNDDTASPDADTVTIVTK